MHFPGPFCHTDVWTVELNQITGLESKMIGSISILAYRTQSTWDKHKQFEGDNTSKSKYIVREGLWCSIRNFSLNTYIIKIYKMYYVYISRLVWGSLLIHPGKTWSIKSLQDRASQRGDARRGSASASMPCLRSGGHDDSTADMVLLQITLVDMTQRNVSTCSFPAG